MIDGDESDIVALRDACNVQRVATAVLRNADVNSTGTIVLCKYTLQRHGEL